MKNLFVLLTIFTIIFITSCVKDDDIPNPSGGGTEDLEGATKITDCAQSGDITWTNHNEGIDYIVSCELRIDDGTFIIENGTSVSFDASASLEIHDDANIQVKGTSSEKVTFTGVEQNQGFWNGIAVRSSDIRNSFDHCVIEYAGANPVSSTWYKFNAGIVGLSTVIEAKISFTNSTIRNCNGSAFVMEGGADLVSFQNNTIESNEDAAVRVSADHVHKIGVGNSYSGNEFDGVSIRESYLKPGNNVEWRKGKYLLEEIDLRAGLTLNPGSDLYFKTSGELRVDRMGYLSAAGCIRFFR